MDNKEKEKKPLFSDKKRKGYLPADIKLNEALAVQLGRLILMSIFHVGGF